MTRLKNFDLNLLVVFATLWQHRSISKAAVALQLTQPAVSNALNRLRVALEDPLFMRTRAGMSPTPVAEQLSIPILNAVKDIKDNILGANTAFDATTSRRRFRIATTDYTALLFLPRLSKVLAEQYASVAIDVISLRERVPFHELESGDIDIALGNFTSAPGTLIRKHLFKDRFVGVCSKHADFARGTLSLSEYVALPHVFVAPWGQLGGAVDDYLNAHGKQRRVAIMVPSFALAPEVIVSTNCISTLPARIVDHFSLLYPIAPFTLPFIPGELQIDALWHPRFNQDRGHKWLRQTLLR